MTWTYNPANLTTDLAKIRLYIGDTNEKDQVLQDEEIAVFQAMEPDIRRAAALCCDAAIAKYARDVDRSNLGMSATRSQKIQHLQDTRDRLLEQANANGGGLFVGGASVAENAKLADDGDAKKPLFKVGQFDNPLAGVKP